MKTTTKKKIAALNRRFKEATPAQRRVLVAKDVLSMIRVGQVSPMPGEWACFDKRPPAYVSAQEALVCNAKCYCCAAGAIFLSGIKFNNRVRSDELSAQADLLYKLHGEYDKTGMMKLFGRSRMALIELAFEGGMGGVKESDREDIGITQHQIDQALRLYDDYDNSTCRITAIMGEIVKSGGNFIV